MEDDIPSRSDSAVEREAAPRRFETALAELEEIVAELEGEQFGLEESLGKYQRGVGLVKAMHEFLRKAQRKIEKLSGFTEEGAPIVENFRDDPAEDAPESFAGGERGRRPTRRGNLDSPLDFGDEGGLPPSPPEAAAAPKAPRAARRSAKADSEAPPPHRGGRRARSDDAGGPQEVDDEPRLF